MISNESYGFSTYVANRIGEIQEKTHSSEWFLVCRKLNISNWLTRGRCPNELDKTSIWQMGPEFLKGQFEQWPVTQKVGTMELPKRIKVVTSQITGTQSEDTLATRINIARFSKFKLLINTTARVLKLYERFQQHSGTYNPEISNADKEKAMIFWIRESQRELHDDVKAHRLVRLVPRYEEGVIMVGGRTDRWMQDT